VFFSANCMDFRLHHEGHQEPDSKYSSNAPLGKMAPTILTVGGVGGTVLEAVHGKISKGLLCVWFPGDLDKEGRTQ
jgi:hypothetical protein